MAFSRPVVLRVCNDVNMTFEEKNEAISSQRKEGEKKREGEKEKERRKMTK